MELVTTEKTYYGPLARGCQQCLKGRKSVLFITGLCHYKCFYCPISDDKRFKDVVKMNERIIARPDVSEGIDEAIEEVRLCQSTGIGITGGDPLLRLDRTCRYIRALKQAFGDSFHTHLYTTLDHVTQEALLKLEEAGLDELRLHFDITDILLWEKAHFAEGMRFTVGVEVPAVPGFAEKTKELINYCKELGFIEFVNINELEYSDAAQSRFTEMGLHVKDELSYAIQGSEDLAVDLVRFGESRGVPVHYCSSEFKDRVQLGNRLRLRAQSVSRPFDAVDEQGVLSRAELKPVAESGKKERDEDENTPDERDTHEKEIDDTAERLGLFDDAGEYDESSSAERLFEGFTLEGIRRQLISHFDLPEEYIEVQGDRILTTPYILEEIWPEIRTSDLFAWKKDFEAARVTEYPTSDHFPIEREVL